MTVIDEGRYSGWSAAYHETPRVLNHRRCAARTRPGGRPTVYRGTGVRTSSAPHTRRPVSIAVTVTLAAVAALITVWLVALAQSRSAESADSAVPDQLAVVQVQPGENLQRLAARVAPDAPVGSVVERIRSLNELDTAALDAGQTLIAPVG